MRFHDGIEIQQLPSFQALMRRLGFEEGKHPKESLKLMLGATLCDGKGEFHSGYTVYGWQEFKDFCHDLGVQYLAATFEIEFLFAEGNAPRVIHSYRPDRQAPAAEDAISDEPLKVG